MKTIVIIIFLAIYSNLYSQIPGWNNIDTTDISNRNNSGSEISPERIALFANHYGVHVLSTQYESDSMHVTYYRLKTTGDLDEGITSSGIDLDDYGDFPNIVGDENILYAVYRKNDTIKVHVSTDGGSNWSSVSPRIFLSGDVNCNGVDAAYSAVKGLHVVWSEKVSSKYESYFNRFDGDDWNAQNFSFTDTAVADSGGFPTVTTSLVSSTPRMHVTINTGTADLLGDNFGRNYSRDFNYSTWADPVAIIPSDSSKMDRLLVTSDDYIHSFYLIQGGTPPFNYRRKSVISESWGSEISIDAGMADTDNLHKIPVTKTSGDTLHAFWVDPTGGFRHKKKYSTSDSWSSEFNVSGGEIGFQDAGACSASNDLFVLYAYDAAGDRAKNYKFRQYDDIPLAPQDLAVESYSVRDVEHPKLTWTLNNEPDVYAAEDAYEIQRRTRIVPGSFGAWSTIDSVDGNVDNYIDTELLIEGTGTIYQAEYKIRAIDLGEHISPWSSIVSILFGDFNKLNTGLQKYDYELSQNYPNPFNPSTRINYTIKKDGLVTLKVYDILGKEVATLVNERKTSGIHLVEFNASNLPSGIYVYKLITGTFTDIKKLILLK